MSNIDRSTLQGRGADCGPFHLQLPLTTPFSTTDMNTIEDAQEEIIDDFSAIDDWMDRYAMIIDMGNALPPIDNALKTPRPAHRRMPEPCMARRPHRQRGTHPFHRRFRRHNSKGIIAMLIKVLNGHTPTRYSMPISISSPI